MNHKLQTIFIPQHIWVIEVLLYCENSISAAQSGSPRLGMKKSFRTLLHQDSMKSFKSVTSHLSQEPSVTSVKETSFSDNNAPYSSVNASNSSPSQMMGRGVAGGVVLTGTVHLDDEKNPLELLASLDPSLILETLQRSIVSQKQTLGLRHKCTPSSRWRHCSHHCVHLLSARIFTVMCHSPNTQHRLVNDGLLKILVDALDPNHDPVSI